MRMSVTYHGARGGLWSRRGEAVVQGEPRRTLRFDGRAVLRLLEVSEHYPGQRRSPWVGGPRGPACPVALWLVHDEGWYLISNSLQSLKVGERQPVVYADGSGPEEDCMLGMDGEDFLDVIPDEPLLRDFLAQRESVLIVEITADRFVVHVEYTTPLRVAAPAPGIDRS